MKASFKIFAYTTGVKNLEIWWLLGTDLMYLLEWEPEVINASQELPNSGLDGASNYPLLDLSFTISEILTTLVKCCKMGWEVGGHYFSFSNV